MEKKALSIICIRRKIRLDGIDSKYKVNDMEEPHTGKDDPSHLYFLHHYKAYSHQYCNSDHNLLFPFTQLRNVFPVNDAVPGIHQTLGKNTGARNQFTREGSVIDLVYTASGAS